ncbi:MAG: hypothetical protein B7Z03_12340 [Hydrogenophilales bacterium 32-62-9]|nr:MAG: hypothetical protein B7Z03_12340 [Hydrogenophilales bacterium 32-62-9]
MHAHRGVHIRIGLGKTANFGEFFQLANSWGSLSEKSGKLMWQCESMYMGLIKAQVARCKAPEGAMVSKRAWRHRVA